MSTDDFTSMDDYMFEKEPDKVGFDGLWVGVANATDQTINGKLTQIQLSLIKHAVS